MRPIQHVLIPLALVAILLLGASCASPNVANIPDDEWVSLSTTARGLYEREDYRRAAAMYDRAVRRAYAIDNADAAAISTANWLKALEADGFVRMFTEKSAIILVSNEIHRINEALSNPDVSPKCRAELQIVAMKWLGNIDLQLDDTVPVSESMKARYVLSRAECLTIFEEKYTEALQILDAVPARKLKIWPLALQADYARVHGDILFARIIKEQDSQYLPEAISCFEKAFDLYKQAGGRTIYAVAALQNIRMAAHYGNLPEDAFKYSYLLARMMWANYGDVPLVKSTLKTAKDYAEKLNDPARLQQVDALEALMQK